VGSLASHWQTPAMSQASITANVHHSLDVHLNLFSQVSFDATLLVNDRPNPIDLFLCQFANTSIRAYVSLSKDFVRSRPADAIYVGETNLNPFIGR